LQGFGVSSIKSALLRDGFLSLLFKLFCWVSGSFLCQHLYGIYHRYAFNKITNLLLELLLLSSRAAAESIGLLTGSSQLSEEAGSLRLKRLDCSKRLQYYDNRF
jgi:hypothetical protein